MYRGLLKVPIIKEVFTYPDMKIIKTKGFERAVENDEDFFQVIMDYLKISEIEVKNDYSVPIIPFLSREDFIEYGGTTLYSKDYKIGSDGRRTKSMLCIYDKTKQMKEVKKTAIEENITRVEFRLFGYFLKKLGGLEGLNCTVNELMMKLKPIIQKKLKKLDIQFSDLYRSLKEDDFLKEVLSVLVEGEEEKSCGREDEKKEESEKVVDENSLLLHLRRIYRSPFKVEKFFYIIKTFVKQFYLLVQLRGS